MGASRVIESILSGLGKAGNTWVGGPQGRQVRLQPLSPGVAFAPTARPESDGGVSREVSKIPKRGAHDRAVTVGVHARAVDETMELGAKFCVENHGG